MITKEDIEKAFELAKKSDVIIKIYRPGIIHKVLVFLGIRANETMTFTVIKNRTNKP